MSNISKYLIQAEFCKEMAERSGLLEGKARWLELAGKWLALADENTQPANDTGSAQEQRPGTG